ncbi:hypothetical protein F2Q69_00044113 [Brassica cretica]|uniref:RNase H type-1 domain-containing protein n=1 Tax=Brassica cretica TaxID=69181 RepID=A0A8S9NLP7_BRACR|nr:hypothetical protein F2Q69_00044113 [Brassica cretica]
MLHGREGSNRRGWPGSSLASKELHRGSCAQDFVSSPCMAESLAIREALLQVASFNYRHICVKSDSQVLDRIQRNSLEFSPISTISLSQFLLRFCFVASVSFYGPLMDLLMGLQRIVYQSI